MPFYTSSFIGKEQEQEMTLIKICDDYLIVGTQDVPSTEAGGARYFCVSKPPKLRRSSYETYESATNSWSTKGQWMQNTPSNAPLTNENERCFAEAVPGGGYVQSCASGIERVDPLYAVGDKIMVKKTITQAHPSVGTDLSEWTAANPDGMYTSNGQIVCGGAYFAADNPYWWMEADFMHDANRDGRKWTWPSGAVGGGSGNGGGMPSGYNPYCIEICEGDSTKTVQILIKDPCDP